MWTVPQRFQSVFNLCPLVTVTDLHLLQTAFSTSRNQITDIFVDPQFQKYCSDSCTLYWGTNNSSGLMWVLSQNTSTQDLDAFWLSPCDFWMNQLASLLKGHIYASCGPVHYWFIKGQKQLKDKLVFVAISQNCFVKVPCSKPAAVWATLCRNITTFSSVINVYCKSDVDVKELWIIFHVNC